MFGIVVEEKGAARKGSEASAGVALAGGDREIIATDGGVGAALGSDASLVRDASVVVAKDGADGSVGGAAEAGDVAAHGAAADDGAGTSNSADGSVGGGADDGGTSADGSFGSAAEAGIVTAVGSEASVVVAEVVADDNSHLEIGQRVASAIYEKKLVSEFLRLEINDMNNALMNLLNYFKEASSDTRTYVTSVALQPNGHRLSIQVWIPALSIVVYVVESDALLPTLRKSLWLPFLLSDRA